MYDPEKSPGIVVDQTLDAERLTLVSLAGPNSGVVLRNAGILYVGGALSLVIQVGLQSTALMTFGLTCMLVLFYLIGKKLVQLAQQWARQRQSNHADVHIDLSSTHLHIHHSAVELSGRTSTVLQSPERIAWADLQAIRHQNNVSARVKSPVMVDDPVMADLPVFTSEDLVLVLNDGSQLAFDLKYYNLEWVVEHLKRRHDQFARGTPSDVPDGIRQLLDKQR